MQRTICLFLLMGLFSFISPLVVYSVESDVHTSYSGRPKVDIITRTFHKHIDILIRNLISTMDVFVNRNRFKLVVVLDDENLIDHQLGNDLLAKGYADSVRYEALPPRYRELFQATAFPGLPWGYDRQQWSTFYLDLYSDADIIGVVDSDSTFASYLTYENILSDDGRILLQGVSFKKSWKTPLHITNDGDQFCNDAVALGFYCPWDLMSTNRMPMFFWRSTFINLRNYIAKLYGVNFDEAYKIFSRNRYCQFNILANYALKFEPEKYRICDQVSTSDNLVSVCQNGCPNTRDILAGGIKSFDIQENEIPKHIKVKGRVQGYGTPIPQLRYKELLEDLIHLNNFSSILHNPCQKKHVDEHYDNVSRDIKDLSCDEQKSLKKNFIKFLEEKFNYIIIK
jgi:hypothetical protein